MKKLTICFGLLIISLVFVQSFPSSDNVPTGEIVILQESGDKLAINYNSEEFDYSKTIPLNPDTGEPLKINISPIVIHNTSLKFIEKNIKEDSCNYCFISKYNKKITTEDGKNIYEHYGECYPLGYRKDTAYCFGDESVKWFLQKENSKKCLYDFECKSNNCEGELCNNKFKEDLENKEIRIHEDKPLVLTIGNKDILAEFDLWKYGWELKLNNKKININLPYEVSPRIKLINYKLNKKERFIEVEFESDISKCEGVSIEEDCLVDESIIIENNDLLNFTFDGNNYNFVIEFVNYNYFKFVDSWRESPTLNKGDEFRLSPFLNLKILESRKTDGVEIYFEVSKDYLCEGYYFNDTCFQNGSTLTLEGQEYIILGHNLAKNEGTKSNEDFTLLSNTERENKFHIESFDKEIKKEDKRFSISGMITGFVSKIFSR